MRGDITTTNDQEGKKIDYWRKEVYLESRKQLSPIFKLEEKRERV